MMFHRIIFWEPTVSPHKVDLFAGLSRCMPDVEIICVADQALLADRRALGWCVDVPQGYEQIVHPSRAAMDTLVDGAADVLHVFSGIRHVSAIETALRLVRGRKARFAIMSEPRVAEGWRGLLRYAQSWLTETWLRREVAFVLAIGRNGPPWFLSVGYKPEKIFPFAYFVEAPDCRTDACLTGRDVVTRVGYVGRLTPEKGVADVIRAVSECHSVQLMIVGAGPQEAELRRCGESLGVQVDWHGVMPINQIPEFMSSLDVLVLASTTTDDGWGVVVSEALLCGTAVIATRCVGASVLLDDTLTGVCVPPADPTAIASALLFLREGGFLREEKRQARRQWARGRLTGMAGAVYLKKILDHCFLGGARPVPFFREKQGD
jgi:glycosyltransferase involved in cell wall biosynthesis